MSQCPEAVAEAVRALYRRQDDEDTPPPDSLEKLRGFVDEATRPWLECTDEELAALVTEQASVTIQWSNDGVGVFTTVPVFPGDWNDNIKHFGELGFKGLEQFGRAVGEILSVETVGFTGLVSRFGARGIAVGLGSWVGVTLMFNLDTQHKQAPCVRDAVAALVEKERARVNYAAKKKRALAVVEAVARYLESDELVQAVASGEPTGDCVRVPLPKPKKVEGHVRDLAIHASKGRWAWADLAHGKGGGLDILVKRPRRV